MAKRKKLIINDEPPAVQLDPLTIKHMNQSRNKMVRLMQRTGIAAASATYDSQHLTPRIRNSMIRMLEQGAVIGGGDAADTAELINEFFSLGCLRIWRNNITITPAVRSNPEIVARLQELSQADLTTALLADKPGLRYRPDRKGLEARHTHNLYLLDPITRQPPSPSSYRGTDMIIDDPVYLVKAAAAVGELRSQATKDKVVEVVASLRAGLQLHFHYDVEVPIVAGRIKRQ